MFSSRAASLAVPSTALSSVIPSRLAEPTSTYPAALVWPVFTPLIHGTRPTRSLRLTTVRTSSPVWSTALGSATARLKNGCVRRS